MRVRFLAAEDLVTAMLWEIRCGVYCVDKLPNLEVGIELERRVGWLGDALRGGR